MYIDKFYNWKLWRLLKVVYFLITISLFIYFGYVDTFLFGTWDSSLYIISLPIIYIFFTDFLVRLLSYINKWNFIWFIPKKIYIIWILIICFILILYLLIYLSETNLFIEKDWLQWI